MGACCLAKPNILCVHAIVVNLGLASDGYAFCFAGLFSSILNMSVLQRVAQVSLGTALAGVALQECLFDGTFHQYVGFRVCDCIWIMLNTCYICIRWNSLPHIGIELKSYSLTQLMEVIAPSCSTALGVVFWTGFTAKAHTSESRSSSKCTILMSESDTTPSPHTLVPKICKWSTSPCVSFPGWCQ